MGEWVMRLKVFAERAPYQFGWIGALPAVVGLPVAFGKSRRLGWFLVLLFAGCVASDFIVGMGDNASALILAFIALLFLMALGFLPLARRRPWLAVAALLVPIIAFGINYGPVTMCAQALSGTPAHGYRLSQRLVDRSKSP
jgi:hypothetical protein